MPAKEVPRDASGRRRIVMGCLGALAGLGACFGVAAGITVWYAVSTPAHVPVERVVGPGTIAAFRFRGDMDDPGISALMRRFGNALAKLQASQMPPSMRWLAQLQAIQVRLSLGMMAPREIGVVLEPETPGSGSRTVFLVAPRHLPRLHQRLMTWMLGQGPSASVTRRGGIDVFEVAPGAFVALTRGTVFMSGSADAIGAVLDRIDAPPMASDVGGRLAALGTEGDGEAVVLLGSRAAMVPPAPGCETLVATADVVDADRIDVRYDVACPSGGRGEGEAFAQGVESTLRGSLPSALSLVVTSEPKADGAAGVAKILGLGAWIDGIAGPATTTPPPPAVRAQPTPMPAAEPAPEEPASDSVPE